jgi:prepilin-type N-terminal cleavage/methylation domain-containing protein
MKKQEGFTLIELLIVVAIIAILAAIAIPNFLAAQTRSKVSRVTSEMRTFATGMESYFVDNNTYIPTRNVLGVSRLQRFILLTTPVAYLSTIPKDIFSNDTGDQQYYPYWGPDMFSDFRTANTVGRLATVPALYTRVMADTTLWMVFSAGPDRDYEPAVPPYGFDIYDPTNGTVSNGDIFRWGP